MSDKTRLLRSMLFADIVGYGTMIAENEESALDLIGEYVHLFGFLF